MLSVIALAVIAAAFWWSAGPDKAIWVAVSVLVATCPCAFSLATPIALTVANGELVRLGIASGKSHVVETLARATDIIFDKTGTVTLGELTVTEIFCFGQTSEALALQLAVALESRSEHPVARAFGRIGKSRAIAAPVVSGIKAFPGRGVEGEISGRVYRIGTLDFVQSLSSDGISPDSSLIGGKQPPNLADECIVLGDASGLMAMFQLADILRPRAVETIRQVREAGIQVHMISGDSAPEVKRIADACGISLWQGRALPRDKQNYLSELKSAGKLVVMVGDGVNDAPVLAAADASLAMGSGASLSQLSADAVILGGRFDSIASAVSVSRKTMQVIRQNLVWSFMYNLLVLPPAIAGWLSPWMAGIGMSLSSVLVVLNALRITRRTSTNTHPLQPAIRRAAI